ncbi:E3 ubiquitin-protein ligase XB3 [Hordeum vulgare]|nr:E3 ubiquitin-protein ligase XB3 [Hordeum vulgare]
MKGSRSDSNPSGSIDSGVTPCGLEEAMAVHIALFPSREDNSRPAVRSVQCDSVVSAQRTLGFSGAGSSRFQRPENLFYPIIGLANCESHRNTHALAREQNRAVRKMAGLPPSVENEVSGTEDNSDDKQIRLDPYRVFDRYFREKDCKGSGKEKGSRG